FVCNRGFWTPWLKELRTRDHLFIAVNLEPVFGSIDEYVPIIEQAVRRITDVTGLPPVLVCHSMGGLAARAWLCAMAADARVRQVITIGSPHHGTWLARFSHLTNGRQMRQDSEWLRRLERSGDAKRNALFTCWYSNCDNIAFPASTGTLASADNRLVRGAAHVDLGFHPQVMAESLARIAAVNFSQQTPAIFPAGASGAFLCSEARKQPGDKNESACQQRRYRRCFAGGRRYLARLGPDAIDGRAGPWRRGHDGGGPAASRQSRGSP